MSRQVCANCGKYLRDHEGAGLMARRPYWDDVANGLFDDPLPRDFDDGDYD